MSRHLIFLAHGSRDSDWLRPMQDLVDGLKASRPEARLSLAFLQHAQPDLPDAVRAAGAHKPDEILVLPLFLSSRGHVQKDVEPMVEKIRLETGAPLRLLSAVGETPEFADMLRRVVERLL